MITTNYSCRNSAAVRGADSADLGARRRHTDPDIMFRRAKLP